jgi:uncharacterized protein
MPSTVDVTLYEPVVRCLRNDFGDRLQAVVLFGSRARGDAGEQSDHDLLVIADSLPKGVLTRARAVRTPLLDSPLRLNLVALTPEELEEELTPLLLDVCVDGVCLFGEDYFAPFANRARAALAASPFRRVRVGRDLVWSPVRVPPPTWSLTWEGYSERPQ